MTTTSFFQTMKDGTQISVNRWIPDGDVKAVVALSHGMAEHSMRYDKLGTVLAEKGFVFSAHDHRGHGRTAQKAEQDGKGTFGYLADKKGFDKVESDLTEVIEKLKADYSGKKVFLIGHSFGSFVSQAFIEDMPTKIDGVVLSGTAGPQKGLVCMGRFCAAFNGLLGKKHRSKALFKLVFGSYNKRFQGRTDCDWISKNESNVDMYIVDQWCGFVPTQEFFRDMFAGLSRIHKSKNIKKIEKNLPVFFMYGEEDPVGDYGKTIKKLSRIYETNGLLDVSVKSYPQDRHEIFNEDDSDSIMNDALAWIESHI